MGIDEAAAMYRLRTVGCMPCLSWSSIMPGAGVSRARPVSHQFSCHKKSGDPSMNCRILPPNAAGPATGSINTVQKFAKYDINNVKSRLHDESSLSPETAREARDT
jgi:hypothetical protein